MSNPKKGSYNYFKGKFKGRSDKFQIDHFPPNSAYTGTPFENQLSYGQRPAFPLSVRRHQFKKGHGGMGYHASSTGNTFVSRRFNQNLNSMMKKGNFFQAMETDLVDKLNVISGSKRENTYRRHLLQGVRYAHRQGMISETEMYHLQHNYLRKKKY